MGKFIGFYFVGVFLSGLLVAGYCDINHIKLTEKQKALGFLTIFFWPISLPLWLLFFIGLSLTILFKKDSKKLFEEKVKDISIDELSLKKRLLQDNLELERELAKFKKN